MERNGKKCIYILTDMKHTVFYVGYTERGLLKKYKEHISFAKSNNTEPVHKHIRKLKYGFYMREIWICDSATKKELMKMEKDTIKMYEKKGVVLKNIVKITCECGVRFSPDYKERHLKTNFHKRYIENDPAYTTKEVISKSVLQQIMDAPDLKPRVLRPSWAEKDWISATEIEEVKKKPKK